MLQQVMDCKQNVTLLDLLSGPLAVKIETSWYENECSSYAAMPNLLSLIFDNVSEQRSELHHMPKDSVSGMYLWEFVL